MDLNNVKGQLESVRKMTESAKEQQRIFEGLLSKTLETAPEQDKEMISKVQTMSIRAIGLAKKGKLEEAQELIKTFGK